jgi:hypothetical protein
MAMRFAAIYTCGHALDGDGEPVALDAARAAERVTYHWAPCLFCQRSGAPVPPAVERYTKRHPCAPGEGDTYLGNDGRRYPLRTIAQEA